MPIGAASYRQIATYWGSPSQGGAGEVTFAAPIRMQCRWEDKNEKFIDAAGAEKTSRSIVWTFSELEVGGYLIQGDQTGVADPTSLQDAMEIKRSDEIPDLRLLNYERKAYL